MNAPTSMALVRLERATLIAGVVAVIVSAILGWLVPDAVSGAYRFAAFACLAPAIGSVIFQLILRMTGGQWGPALQPFLSAGAALLPWIWLLTLPLLFFPGHAVLEASEPPDWYGSHAMIVLRALIYGLLFLLIARGLVRVHRLRLAGDHTSLRWVAPAGLITLVFMLHLLAEDWLVSLDPGWHSTAFPAVWVTGQTLAGFCVALFCAVLGGADPKQSGSAGRSLGPDWGNLLLTATMFFVYVAFAQFLIIWAGNLPREISWYQLRTDGPWLWVIVGLAVFHFGLPFLFLLSRRFKRFPAGLAGIALVLFAGQLTYLAWLILPAFQPLGPRAFTLAFTLSAAALGFFLNRYLAAARQFGEARL